MIGNLGGAAAGSGDRGLHIASQTVEEIVVLPIIPNLMVAHSSANVPLSRNWENTTDTFN